MKVLVVDDDVVSRMVLMHLIDACGSFEILEAEDGEDAWQQMAGGLRPAICFCDLRMPRLSGMELLQRVKADSALGATPFVLVTSASDSATVEQANGLGADGYLVKPFNGEQVKDYLNALSQAARVPAVVAESPQASMQRLGITGERLLVYLGGFQAQLAAAAADIANLLARADNDGARLRLDRLHAGCLTLGLSGAAEALRAVAPGPLENAQVQPVLAATVRCVVQQIAALEYLNTLT